MCARGRMWQRNYRLDSYWCRRGFTKSLDSDEVDSVVTSDLRVLWGW